MRLRNVGFCLLVLLALPLLSFAADTGSIAGIVRDEDGKPLADARVSLSGSGNSINRQTSSSSSGQFRFVGLPAGDYALSAELSGYTAKASAFIHLESSTGTASAELILLRSGSVGASRPAAFPPTPKPARQPKSSCIVTTHSGQSSAQSSPSLQSHVSARLSFTYALH